MGGLRLYLTSIAHEQPVILPLQECICFKCKTFSLIWFYGTGHDWNMCYTYAAHAKGDLPETLNDICASQSLVLKAKQGKKKGGG